MSTERRGREVTDLPEWAKRIHQEYGSPELGDLQDVFLGPLIKRRSGLRKDDLIEILKPLLIKLPKSERPISLQKID